MVDWMGYTTLFHLILVQQVFIEHILCAWHHVRHGECYTKMKWKIRQRSCSQGPTCLLVGSVQQCQTKDLWFTPELAQGRVLWGWRVRTVFWMSNKDFPGVQHQRVGAKKSFTSRRKRVCAKTLWREGVGSFLEIKVRKLKLRGELA